MLVLYIIKKICHLVNVSSWEEEENWDDVKPATSETKEFSKSDFSTPNDYTSNPTTVDYASVAATSTNAPSQQPGGVTNPSTNPSTNPFTNNSDDFEEWSGSVSVLLLRLY